MLFRSSDIERMKVETNVNACAEIADGILKRNSYVAVAYSVKARQAYARGDFANVIKYKTQTIKTAPFSHTEYWEYAQMLISGVKLYEEAGDQASAEICRKELLSVWKALPAQKNRLSKYGAAIVTQPRLNFPQELKEQILAIVEE